jgi:uncharacterized protein YeaO (DUF488 family)
MRFQTKRIYAAAEPSDGRRILIDRLWPRGMSKQRAAVDYWAKEIAPSNGLRRWYQHDVEKWPEFLDRYFVELDASPDGLEQLHRELERGLNTILFASKEERLNNAAALILYLDEKR